MKKALYILIPLLIALTLRLYPTFISGMPFSVDSWPIIRNTELLMHNTPIPLNSGIFDGYNNFMPANQLFGAVLSRITNLPPITAMAFGIPIVAALTIPIFYALVRKITGNNKTPLIASVLLAAAFPYALFTAGVTKETFASPIYIALILLFLQKHSWKTSILFSIASIALVLAHQLTTFFAIIVIISLSIALYSSKASKEQKINSNKSNMLFAAILSTIFGLYFGFFAGPALHLTIVPSEFLAFSAYQIFFTAAVLFFAYTLKNQFRKKTLFGCILGFVVVSMLMLLTTLTPLLPGAPVLPLRYFLYALPFMIVLPLTAFALNEIYKKHLSLMISLFWLIPVVAFASYAVFANPPGGFGLAYRSVNFLLPPLIILTAIGLNKLYTSSKHVKTSKFSKFVAVAIIVSIVTINSYTLYATVSLQEPYLGYFWRYQPTEYSASYWVTLNTNNQTITGDVKISHILGGYFNKSVNYIDGLRFLQGNGSKPEVLYIYNQMYTNGYVLSGSIPVALPENWTDQLIDYNYVYANSEVTIYARR